MIHGISDEGLIDCAVCTVVILHVTFVFQMHCIRLKSLGTRMHMFF